MLETSLDDALWSRCGRISAPAPAPAPWTTYSFIDAALDVRSLSELHVTLAQAFEFCPRQLVGMALTRHEIRRQKHPAHQAPRLVTASRKNDMAEFVREDPSQGPAHVCRRSERVADEREELCPAQRFEQALGSALVDVNGCVVDRGEPHQGSSQWSARGAARPWKDERVEGSRGCFAPRRGHCEPLALCDGPMKADTVPLPNR
jgi:hypothetical protein